MLRPSFFSFTFSYNLGKLPLTAPGIKGISNADLKQGDQNPQGGGTGGPKEKEIYITELLNPIKVKFI